MTKRDSGARWRGYSAWGAALRGWLEQAGHRPGLLPLASVSHRPRRSPQAVRIRPADTGRMATGELAEAEAPRCMPLNEPIPSPTPVDDGALVSAPIPIAHARSARPHTDADGPGWKVARAAYRHQWQRGAGRTGGDWDDAEPGYRYGFQRAMERGVPRRSWKQVEGELAAGFADWARPHGYDPRWVTWASMCEHVRIAWEERAASVAIASRQERAS
jgi:hypothetical protein